MPCVLTATPATAALATLLSLSPLSSLAQEAEAEGAGASDTVPDPATSDDILPTDRTTAVPGEAGDVPTGDPMIDEEPSAPEGATTERTQNETADEGNPEAESAATDTEEDESEEVGNRARLAATLASAEEAAADVRAAAARLPDIVDRIDALVGELEELPVEELVGELTSLASSANALVSSEATQALPADLSAALAEVEAILRDLREGGVIENANATLQSTRVAADTLPGLAERASVLLDQAGATVEGFQGSESILREAERAIREVADAADAVASLARAIERDPNSLLFGR